MTRFPKSTCTTTWWFEWSTGSQRINYGSISTWSMSRLSVFGKDSFWWNLVLSKSKIVYSRELAMTWCGCLVLAAARRSEGSEPSALWLRRKVVVDKEVVQLHGLSTCFHCPRCLHPILAHRKNIVHLEIQLQWLGFESPPQRKYKLLSSPPASDEFWYLYPQWKNPEGKLFMTLIETGIDNRLASIQPLLTKFLL